MLFSFSFNRSKNKSGQVNLDDRSIAFRLFGLALLCSWLVQDGTLSVIDTIHRYQLTRFIWQGGPGVYLPDLATNEVLIGVGGRPYYQYGMGQSILMLPGDILSEVIVRLLGFQTDMLMDATLKSWLLAALTFPVFSAGAVALGFLLLREMDFKRFQAGAGALSLFFATTLLPYAQYNQENNQIVCLTLAGYYLLVKWVKYDRWLYLLVGSAVLSSMLLLRVTNLVSQFGVVGFALLALLWYSPGDGKGLAIPWQRIFRLLVVQLVSLIPFVAIDRLYQLQRFGSLTTTYMQVFSDQAHAGIYNLGPTYGLTPAQLPPQWPYGFPRLEAAWYVLFSPMKSIFLYDPLLLVLLLVVVGRRFKLEPKNVLHLRTAYLLSGLVALAGYLYSYTNVVFWHGDWAWGARYYTPAVDGLALLAVPLCLEVWANWPRMVRWAVMGLVGLAVLVQLSSLTFNVSLEIAQEMCRTDRSWLELPTSSFRIGERWANIFRLVSGQSLSEADCPLVMPLNFAPFRLMDISSGLRAVLLGLWLFGILLAGRILLRLIRVLRAPAVDHQIRGQT